MDKNYYIVFSRLSSVCYCLAYYISDIQLRVEIKIIQAYYIIMSNCIIILSSHYFYHQVTFNAEATNLYKLCTLLYYYVLVYM